MNLSSISNTIYDDLSSLRTPLITKKVTINATTPYDEEKVEKSTFSRKDFSDIDTSISVKTEYYPETIGYNNSAADVSKLINKGFTPSDAIKIKKADIAYSMNMLSTNNNSQQTNTQSYNV